MFFFLKTTFYKIFLALRMKFSVTTYDNFLYYKYYFGFNYHSFHQSIAYHSIFHRFSFESVCQWRLTVQFCRLHHLPLTTCFVKSCCQTDNWLSLFLFIHLYQMPPDHVSLPLTYGLQNTIFLSYF